MNDAIEKIQQEVKKIVASGNAIRENVTEVVTKTTRDAYQQVGGGIADVARAVAEGAREGAAKVTEDNRAEALRQVADGLADGLTASANAARLTLEEAAARGRHFAEQDLTRLNKDLKQMRELFLSAMSDVSESLRREGAAQAGDLKQHVDSAAARVGAALDSVLKALTKEPGATAAQAADAGRSAVVHAVGTLFSELGQRLQQAGARLKQ